MREAGSALSRNGIWASELFQGPQGSSLSLMEPPSHLGVSDVAPPECLTSTADGAHQGPQVAHHKEPRGRHSAACPEPFSSFWG